MNLIVYMCRVELLSFYSISFVVFLLVCLLVLPYYVVNKVEYIYINLNPFIINYQTTLPYMTLQKDGVIWLAKLACVGDGYNGLQLV